MIGIYLIRNKINGKVYIGKSSNIESRWKSHRSESTNVHLRAAIAKYGVGAFEFSILEISTLDRLNELEKYYISKYKSTDSDKGYNLTKGGDGGSLVGEALLKRAESIKRSWKDPASGFNRRPSIKGSSNPMYGKSGCLSPVWGKHHSAETRRKISESNKSYGNHMKGKTGSGHHFYGEKHSQESLLKMSKNRKGKCTGETNPSSKKVVCLETDEKFCSISEFVKILNIPRSAAYPILLEGKPYYGLHYALADVDCIKTDSEGGE